MYLRIQIKCDDGLHECNCLCICGYVYLFQYILQYSTFLYMLCVCVCVVQKPAIGSVRPVKCFIFFFSLLYSVSLSCFIQKVLININENVLPNENIHNHHSLHSQICICIYILCFTLFFFLFFIISISIVFRFFVVGVFLKASFFFKCLDFLEKQNLHELNTLLKISG